MRQIDYSAFIISLGLIAFNFCAYYFVSPHLFVEPDAPAVRENAWALANASTLVLTPVILVLCVLFPGLLRSPPKEEVNG